MEFPLLPWIHWWQTSHHPSSPQLWLCRLLLQGNSCWWSWLYQWWWHLFQLQVWWGSQRWNLGIPRGCCHPWSTTSWEDALCPGWRRGLAHTTLGVLPGEWHCPEAGVAGQTEQKQKITWKQNWKERLWLKVSWSSIVMNSQKWKIVILTV